MRYGRSAAVLLGIALIAPAAGCGDDDTTTGQRTPPKPQTTPAASEPEPEFTPPPLPKGTTVRFRATDGVRLKGTLTASRERRAPAVVLVHQYQGGPDQWEAMVPYLQRAGYATLRYASRPGGGLDETLLARDARGAVAALRRRSDIDPRRVSIMGASIGGTTAAYVAGIAPDIRLRAAIGLSPADSATLIKAGSRYRPRALLLIADEAELADAEGIEQDANGRGVTLRQSKLDGHGVDLIPDATVRSLIIRWLDSHSR